MRYAIKQVQPGKGATLAALQEMKKLTLEALQSDEVRRAANDIITIYVAAGPLYFVEAVHAYILAYVRITDEFGETLISPLRMLREIKRFGRTSGDCDDVAMLAASLFAVMGFGVRFKAIGQTPRGWYSHVFVEYLIAGLGWRPFDPTIKGVPVYNSDDYIIQVV